MATLHEFPFDSKPVVVTARPQDSADAIVDRLFQPARRFEALTEDQMALLDATDVLERLADRLGSYRRVENVLRTVAMIHGEAL